MAARCQSLCLPLGVFLVTASCASPETTKPGPGTTSTSPASTSSLLAALDDASVQSSGVITCEDPGARESQVFQVTEIGAEWPMMSDWRTEEWSLVEGSRGVIVADLDGDDIEDLFVPRDDFDSVVLKGLGDGSFIDISVDALPQQVHFINGGTAADLDEDGDLDLFLYRLEHAPLLLFNDGNAQFSVTERPEWNLDDGIGCGCTASFADYDRDGHLDLFYGRLGFNDQPYGFHMCPSLLFRGLGNGELEDVSELITDGVQATRILGSGWWDMDDDGWVDLYTVADCAPSPQPNTLMWNQGDGSFAQAEGSGLDVSLASMGLGGGDLNGDGRPDLIVPGIREFAMLMSAPEYGDLWIESSVAMGLDMVGDQALGWGGEFVDFDNDGWLDTLATMGRDAAADNNELWQPDALYRNLGDNTFEQVGEAWGWDQDTVTRGEIVADLNDDGWLDIVTRELGGVVFVHLANCGEGNWLEITLHDGLHPNVHAIGAKVSVSTASGRVHHRWVTQGSISFTSGGPPDLHFGLGVDDHVTRIDVRWPTGETTSYGWAEANQILDITRL